MNNGVPYHKAADNTMGAGESPPRRISPAEQTKARLARFRKRDDRIVITAGIAGTNRGPGVRR